jgi:ribonuclease BN (tRNA processing enzyme)
VKIHFLGVRGSTSAPGAEFVRFGGHTSCVAIERPDGRWLVLDAGTGFRELGKLLAGNPLQGSILLSHLHWDHTEGLPFLPNADRVDAKVAIFVPAEEDGPSAVAALSIRMAPPYFPITPEGLMGEWVFVDMVTGKYEIEGLSVTATKVHHKGGRTYGYRIDDGQSVAVYISDHSFLAASEESQAAVVELCRDADVLMHDAQFNESEREIATLYGHSTVDECLELAERANVKHLLLTHHAPGRTDAQLDVMREALGAYGRHVTFAYEGLVLDV